MLEVRPRKNEPIESVLKRLKIKVFESGLMDDWYRCRRFETPAQKKARKQKMSIKKRNFLKNI